MKLFQLIAFAALWIATPSLHAAYPAFNIGKEKIGPYVLSPDGKLLATYTRSTVRIWDIPRGQLRSEFNEKSCVFFSSDSTMLFAISMWSNEIVPYDITHEEVVSPKDHIWNIDEYKGDNFKSASSAYIGMPDKLIKLSPTKRYWNSSLCGLFITQLLPDGTTQTQEIDHDYFSSIEAHATTISSDAQLAAIAGERNELPFIHVINLSNQQTTHNYCLKWNGTIKSINFSPDKNKLVLARSFKFVGNNIFESQFIVIDLQTHQSSCFDLDKPIEYAAFVDDSTVLVILQDGSVNYHELTQENLEQNCITDAEEFRVVAKSEIISN